MPFFTSFSGKILSAPGLKLGPKRIIVTLSSNQANYSFTPLQVPGYVTGAEITLVIDPGVYVYSTSTSSAGLSISNFSGDDIVNIINNGYIMGMGGQGGAGIRYKSATAGSSGGPAIDLNYPVSITNNSYIGGGGGGGGGCPITYSPGTNYGGGGGAGGGQGGLCQMEQDSRSTLGGAGGAPGAKGSNGGAFWAATSVPGGGGRIMPGSATTALSQGGEAGGSGGGAAGVGPPYSLGGGAGNPGSNGKSLNYGTSGGGGGWGASGGIGAGFRYAGGAGGKAVNLNGNSVTWIATGTRYGAIS